MTIKDNNSLRGSIVHFGHVDLFLGLTLLYIIAVYSLSLTIIIFKIITKKRQNFLKITISEGSNPTTECPIHLKISGQIDLDLMNNITPVRFALNALVFEL